MAVEKFGELVHLVTLDAIVAGMAEDILLQNGVAHVKRSVSGAGVARLLGMMTERFMFFVPEEFFDRAKDLVECFFDNQTI